MKPWPGISTYEYWQDRRTEAMRSLLDSPIFTNLSTNILNQKDPTMRLTKIGKARAAKANAIAIAKAKDDQHARLVAQLQGMVAQVEATNTRLRTQYGELEKMDAEHRAQVVTATAQLANRDQSIAAFKQEVLALTTENATLRGYMARVLEDDTVREVGGAKPADTVLCEEDRSHMQQALHQDNYARRQPPRSVRTGPCPPMIIAGCDMAGDWNPSQWDRAMRKAPAEPKHWLQR